MMDLGEYLRVAGTKPWDWGTHDCSSWPAIWAGIPLPDYHDEDGAEAHIADAGGLIPLWERCIGGRLAKISPVDVEAGDVAIIHAVAPSGSSTQVGAIWTGKRWAFLTPRGRACASATAVAAWRVECPKR